MSFLKSRVRRLSRGIAVNADAWLRSLSDAELLFLVHYYTRAVLADPAIAAEDRAKVAAELIALPLARWIDEERAASLLKEEAW
jgi:hypothetical protein